jgi:hypothetical protein
MTPDTAAYDRNMALSRAHATVAQALKYPMLVNFGALQAARALIEASHVLDARKPMVSQNAIVKSNP